MTRLVGALLLLMSAWLPAGCAATPDGGGDEDFDRAAVAAALDPAPTGADDEDGGAASGKGRATLWAANCARCHNARPATFYSEAEWQIAMHHMRVRAGLTAAETQAIWEFFKASK